MKWKDIPNILLYEKQKEIKEHILHYKAILKK